MYVYLNIGADNQYSSMAPAIQLCNYLSTLSGLKRTGPVTFSNIDTYPWFQLTLLECDANGNYSSNGNEILSFNLVELIGIQSENHTIYCILAEHIASFLQWQIIDVSHY